MKKIFWVASYPRSGNTWVRSILASLFFTDDGKFEFSFLKHIPLLDRKQNYEFVKNINIEDFNNLNNIKNISKYWYEVQKLAKVNDKFGFFKTHSANITVDNKFHYVNKDFTNGIVLIIRDPRDVVVSFSKHLNISIDETINVVINNNAVIKSGNDAESLPMMHLNWEQFYLSWLSLDIPILVIKYEDIIANTHLSIENIVDYFENNFDLKIKNKEIKIKNILESTNFKNMQGMEKKYGFKELKTGLFFRKGETMQWKKALTKKQVVIIEQNFTNLMNKFGYFQ